MTEAAAAKEAGLSTLIVVRDGNAVLTREERLRNMTIKSFLELTFQSPTKRQKTIDEQIIESTYHDCEPMDTSEDVDTSDRDIGQSNQTVEEGEAKEVAKAESERKGCTDSQPSKDSMEQKEEPMTVEKNSPKVEQETAIAKTVEPDIKETSEKSDVSESVEQTAKDDKAAKDGDNVTEKTEENFAVKATPTVNDSMDVSVPESTSEFENVPASSEKKSEGTAEPVKDTPQIDVADDVGTATDKKANDHASQTCEKSVKKDNSEDLSKIEKDEVKDKSKIVSGTLNESENVSAKSETSEPEEMAKLQSEADLVGNGETVEATGAEKSSMTTAATVKPAVAEVDAAANAAIIKEDVTPSTKVSTEKKSFVDVNEHAEKTDEKTETTGEIKTEELTPTDEREERGNESTKQETAKEKETVKEGNVVDTKDKNTVDSEKQKLNGTAQNGDTDVPVLDDKLHSNGLNEGSSKETTTTTCEDGAETAQNGKPESSSESSAESIKIKKVVDSTVADGAGEPDVVPPVVVAATS